MKLIFLIVALFVCLPFAAEGGSMVQLKSGEEEIQAYWAKPSGVGPFPAMILIHEWWGLNDQIKGIADRFASEGYAALAVDLYRGNVTADPDLAHQYMSGLPEDRAVRDMKAAFDYLQQQKDIRKDRIGSIGWCMGGGYSLRLALNEPRLSACVIYYGRLVTDPESLKKINSPVLGIFAENDQAIPPEMAKKFEEQMKVLGKEISVHIYPASGHGFFNETGKRYNPDAAKDAWSKTVSFLQKHLKGS